MGNTIGKFTFHMIKMDTKTQFPFSPIVSIGLGNWTTSDSHGPIISPDLMTEQEIDEHIRALKDDLDAVGQKAKAALREAKGKARS